MGLVVTTVVSTVASPGPDWTKLPSVIRVRLTRPSMGEVILVNSRFSWASRTAASADWIEALMNGEVRHVLLVLVLADGARGTQPLAARQVGLGLVGQRQQPHQIAFGPVQRRLVGTRIDFVEQVSLLHVLAVHEVHLHEITGHARANFHLAHGLRLAGELKIVGHFARHRLADGHFGRRLLRRLGNPLRTTRQTKQGACDAGGSPPNSRCCHFHQLVPLHWQQRWIASSF